jgi:hypothetical protein
MRIRLLGFALWVAAFIAWLHFFASREFWWGPMIGHRLRAMTMVAA